MFFELCHQCNRRLTVNVSHASRMARLITALTSTSVSNSTSPSGPNAKTGGQRLLTACHQISPPRHRHLQPASLPPATALHQQGGLACSIHPTPRKSRPRIISSISPRKRISQIAAILPGIDRQRLRNAPKMIIAPRSPSTRGRVRRAHTCS